MSRINLYDPKDVRAVEVRQYMKEITLTMSTIVDVMNCVTEHLENVRVFNHLISEFLKCTLPFLNLDLSIIAIRGVKN